MSELSTLEILLLRRHYHWSFYTPQVDLYPQDQVEETYHNLEKRGLIKLSRRSYKLTEAGAEYFHNNLRRGDTNE